MAFKQTCIGRTEIRTVAVYLHDNIQANTVEVDDGNCELVWAEIQTKGKSIVIGSYYRPPSATIDSLQHLCCHCQPAKF